MYSEKDLKDAAAFREGVHREALAKIRQRYPDIDAVVDRYDVEDYFQQYWDYPGAWYTMVAIPAQCKSRDGLIDVIVQDTIAYHLRSEAKKEPPKKLFEKLKRPPKKPVKPEKPQKSADGHNRESEDDRCPDDPFYRLIAKYPDCAVDYCIVSGDPLLRQGCEAHWRALTAACKKLFAPDEDGEAWQYDTDKARGKRIDAKELFSSGEPSGALTYRRAFLRPPHGSGYRDSDFAKVNAALFPNGTDGLEVYEWTTDWSDYFDDGHEWWGALCLTVCDKKRDRFVVILASATD